MTTAVDQEVAAASAGTLRMVGEVAETEADHGTCTASESGEVEPGNGKTGHAAAVTKADYAVAETSAWSACQASVGTSVGRHPAG
jgi:hypothetical protein